MVMLTIYFDLNVTLNYSRLYISMLKCSLDQKILNLTCKTKLTLSCETNSTPETTTPSNLRFKSNKHFNAKKNKLNTSPQSYYGDRK